MCLVNDLNQLYQQHPDSVAIVACNLVVLLVCLVLALISVSWICKQCNQFPTTSCNRLMQSIHYPSFNANDKSIRRLPSAFSFRSVCSNEDRLLINLLKHLLFYSLVYLYVLLVLPGLKSPSNHRSNGVSNVSSSNVLFNESFDLSSNLSPNVQFHLVLFVLFLLLFFLRSPASFFKRSFLSTLACCFTLLKSSSLRHTSTITATAAFRSSKSTSKCQKASFAIRSILYTHLLSSLDKLPNFSLFLFSTKLSSDTTKRNVIRLKSTTNWLTVLVLSNSLLSCQAVKKSTLYTAGFFPLSGEEAELGLGILPAVQLALDDITDNNIIPGYKLDLVGNDTMVSTFLRGSLAVCFFCCF